MADYIIQGTTLTAIADSIRAKTGSADPIPVADMATAIEGITGGGGEGVPDGYATVTFHYTDQEGNPKEFSRLVMIGDDCPDPWVQKRIETPTKESTAQYDYTFNGWASAGGGTADETALQNITEDKVLYAAFAGSVRMYTVTYYDEDGVTVLHTEQVGYGSMPSYVPTKEGAVLGGWIPTPAPVSGDVSYTASWISALGAGSCGDTATWFLSGDGVLTISGTGEVTANPWYPKYGSGEVDLRQDIKALVIEEGITGIGRVTYGEAFYACRNLTSVTLPTTLTHITSSAFNQASGITEVHIPSLEWWWDLSLGTANSTPVRSSASVFAGGTKISGELVVPNSVTSILSYQFYGWSGITSVVFHSGVTSIGNYAFNASGIKSVVLPDTITSVGISAFSSCNSLTSIDFGEITAIPSSVCASCSRLSSVVLSDNTTEIGQGAFSGTTLLKINFVIPASVTKFGYNMVASSGVTGVTFEDAEGWTATKYVGDGPDTVSFTASDLADPSVNARNLRSTSYYQYYNWTKS